MSPLTFSEWKQFIGISYHRHWVNRLVYTDGVKYLALQKEASGLIGAIAKQFSPFEIISETGKSLGGS